MEAALRFMAGERMDLILTSGGLGPTADDLTAEVVGGFQGRELVLDEALDGRIAEIVRPLAERWPNLDREAMAAGKRKQAMVPRGATVLEPVGTAPGLVVPRRRGGPVARRGRRSWCCRGRRASCSRCGDRRSQTDALRAALRGATEYRQRTLRLFGIPESEIAETLRVAEREGVELEQARGHDVPETGRGRGRDSLRARRRGGLRRVC